MRARFWCAAFALATVVCVVPTFAGRSRGYGSQGKGFQASASSAGQADSLENVLKSARRALYGDRWDGVYGIRMTGTQQAPGRNSSPKIDYVLVCPSRMLHRITMPGRDPIEAGIEDGSFVGQMPLALSREAAIDQELRSLRRFSWMWLLNKLDPAFALAYQGIVGDGDAKRHSVTAKVGNDTYELLLDASSFRPVAIKYAPGMRLEFQDYRTGKGLTMPYRMTWVMEEGGTSLEWFVEQYEINPTWPDTKAIRK
jgi:hypothetical protein